MFIVVERLEIVATEIMRDKYDEEIGHAKPIAMGGGCQNWYTHPNLIAARNYLLGRQDKRVRIYDQKFAFTQWFSNELRAAGGAERQ
jgi:hypothetical protein